MEPPTSDAGEEPTVRRSTRNRPLTEKALDNALQELKRNFWVQHGKFAIYLNQVQIQMSGDCDHGALKTMEAEIQDGHQQIDTIYDEIKVMSVTTPDQEIRLGIDRVEADRELLLKAIQNRMKEDVDTHHSISDRSERSKTCSHMSSGHTNETDTSSQLRVAKANAAARQIELSALTKKAEQEDELEELQRQLVRKKREIEHQRLSVLLRAEEAKIQVYADTQSDGVLNSPNQLYSAMQGPSGKSISAPSFPQNVVIDEPRLDGKRESRNVDSENDSVRVIRRRAHTTARENTRRNNKSTKSAIQTRPFHRCQRSNASGRAPNICPFSTLQD